jgi:anti-sigma factor RsiW
MNIDHERCSESLGAYLRDELDADTRRAVATHLAGCEECELELRGLTALTAEPAAPDSLTDDERVALHRSLAASRSISAKTIAPARRSPWARVAPALGAAALIVLGVFALVRLDLQGGDDEGDAAGADRALEEQAEPLPATEVEVGGPDIASNQPKALSDAAGEAAAGGAAPAEEFGSVDESRTAASRGAVAARFDPDAGSFDADDLRRYAANQSPFTVFPLSYRASDADAPLSRSYLESLAGAAPRIDDGTLLRSCSEQVLQQDIPILPVYGAFGKLDGRDVLVLGFVYARNGELDRFRVWVWPRGDCDIPVLTQDGNIRY